MALGINSSVEGTTLTLELSGRLSTQETREFDITFAEKVQGMKQALLDFSKVEYISSSGLRSLFTAKKKMTQQGGELTLLYPSQEVGEVLQATRFDNLIKVVWRKEEENVSQFYPLRPIQRWMVDTHFMKAKSTMMNTGALIRLDPSLDMERLAAALNDVLASYDIFRLSLIHIFAIAPQPETNNYMVLEASADRLRFSCYLPDGTKIDEAEVKK